MRTYTHLFDYMISPEVVKKSALDAAEGKLGRTEVRHALEHFDDTYECVMRNIYDENFRPCEDNTHEIIDGANHKKRDIEKPRFLPEQIIHHMLIEAFAPVLTEGLYEHVYGCLPPSPIKSYGKIVGHKKYGPHQAVKRMEKWVRNGKKMYVVEADVHHAYGSVKISILASLMEKYIKDKRWLDLTYKFLHYDKTDEDMMNTKGLVLGHYTSPWFFNFYLKEFDHHAASFHNVKYLRFADNIFMVSTSKRDLRRAFNSCEQYLNDKLELTLNSSKQLYRFEYFDKKTWKVRGRAINMLGVIIHYNRRTLRKNILMQARRKAVKLSKKYQITWHDAASMMSRLSWIYFTDTYAYYITYIKHLINIGRMKNLLRRHSKLVQPISMKRRERIYDCLEKSYWLTGGNAYRV